MKKLIITQVLILVLSISYFVRAQSLEDVLCNVRRAVGGEEAWSKIQTLKLSGEINKVSAGFTIDFIEFYSKPGKIHQTLETGGEIKVRVVNEKDAWTKGSDFGTKIVDLLSFYAVSLSRMSDFEGPFFQPEKKEYKVSFLGKDEQGFYIINFVANDWEMKYHIDPNSWLFRKIVVKEGGDTYVHEIKEYRDIEGLKFPVRTEKFWEDELLEIRVVNEIELNQNVEKSLFLRPSQKE